MPHRCAGCNTLFPDARFLKDGCPVCGSGKFIFEKGRQRKETRPQETENPEMAQISPDTNDQGSSPKLTQTEEPVTESIESIRILEPGRYDLNLSRLMESDDRVIRVGSEDNYRLDLHSIVREKRKK